MSTNDIILDALDEHNYGIVDSNYDIKIQKKNMLLLVIRLNLFSHQNW